MKVEEDATANLTPKSTTKQVSPEAFSAEHLIEDETNLVSEEDEKPDTDWCTFEDFCKICTLDISESDKMTRWHNLFYDSITKIFSDAESLLLRNRSTENFEKKDGLFLEMVSFKEKSQQSQPFKS